jgi:hypothetical protein
MPDPNLPMLEDALRKLAPFLDEIVFVGGVTLGLLITDDAAAPIRGTTDVDVIAEILTSQPRLIRPRPLQDRVLPRQCSGQTPPVAPPPAWTPVCTWLVARFSSSFPFAVEAAR